MSLPGSLCSRFLSLAALKLAWQISSVSADECMAMRLLMLSESRSTMH